MSLLYITLGGFLFEFVMQSNKSRRAFCQIVTTHIGTDRLSRDGAVYVAMTGGSMVMLKANWMVLLIIGTLLPAAGLADDAASFGTKKPLPLSAPSLDSQQAEPVYALRWRPALGAETISRSDHWSRSMQDFDFQDSGILGRMSKLRGLSFLTIAEAGKSRLFLGVNKDGLVGLHFHAFPGQGNRRYLEVARMPYLRKSETDIQTN
jgi:hypothetical protein